MLSEKNTKKLDDAFKSKGFAKLLIHHLVKIGQISNEGMTPEQLDKWIDQEWDKRKTNKSGRAIKQTSHIKLKTTTKDRLQKAIISALKEAKEESGRV
ncbi:MAG: hypothetical protein WCI52_04135 [bacterium]